MLVLRAGYQSASPIEALEVLAEVCDGSQQWKPPSVDTEEALFELTGVRGRHLPPSGILQAFMIEELPYGKRLPHRWVPHPMDAPLPEGWDLSRRFQYHFDATHVRVGREHQRYGTSGDRLVVGAIVVKWENGVPEVLLISSSKGEEKGGYVIPQGGWDDDETMEHCILREVWEEAGVECLIVGLLDISSSPSKTGTIKTLHIFVLQMEQERDAFPEQAVRYRRWVKLSDAPQLLTKGEHKRLFDLPKLADLIEQSQR